MEKVIIIGAGPAGLTAAIELLKNGGDYDVTILEGSQAMGGISQTVRYNGNRTQIFLQKSAGHGLVGRPYAFAGQACL